MKCPYCGGKREVLTYHAAVTRDPPRAASVGIWIPCAACTAPRDALAERMLAFSNMADETHFLLMIYDNGEYDAYNPTAFYPEERRQADRVIAYAIAAFICWASGGCDVLRGGE